MIKEIIGIVLYLIPITYGIYLYIQVVRITKKSTKEELEAMDKKLTRMKRSSSIFFFVGVYMIYEAYKRLF
ncbi:MAG: hypothetical protein JXR64_04425 [Spirochaetales bacterium]|nr:hypothetical protein [Spirochaetales bacterium]